ncbi:hypothetical protein [Anatilimnocola floriformis]|uniref:hypothetical protein n=1 Tax=Anatilimnocola floriformis TaxID=2948575 RepID=UPI0020C37EBF|nr:hypothetical protein [Anatilimnocola floriformis]
MRIFTTLIAIFALALHLLLGCCWHHAHGAEELTSHQHESAGHHVHLPGCCGHSHSQAADHDDEAPADSDSAPSIPCSDPQCVYVVSGQAQVPAAHDIALPLAIVDQQPAETLVIAFVHDLAEQERISPHLRRHLALSRLLN